MSAPGDDDSLRNILGRVPWRKVIGISVFVILATVLLAVTLFYVYMLTIHHKVDRFQKGYDRVERGITTAELVVIMGEPTFVKPTLRVKYWDWDELPQADADRLATAYCYSVDTFFLPITFAIGLDADGKVVGKHRYD